MTIKETTKPLLDVVENAVDAIAMARAAATVIDGMAEEEFDKFINDECEKAFAKYTGKGKGEIIMMMTARLIEKDPKFLLELLMGGEL